MTVKELHTLVDNLDEYIHVPDGIARLKKTILQLAISGQLVQQDPSEGTGQELYDQIQAEKQKLIADGKLKKQKPLPEVAENEIPFGIPESWKWVRLADASLVITDGDHQAPPRSDEGIPFLVIGDVRNGSLNMNAASRKVPREYFEKLDWAHTPQAGDLLYTTVGSYGIPVPVLTTEEFCFQRHIGLVRPGTPSVHGYLLIYLRSSFALEQATKYATGIAQKTVPVSGIRNFPLPLPPLDEQLRIVKKIDSIFGLIDELSKKYQSEQAERRKLVMSSLSHLSANGSNVALGILAEIIKTRTDVTELRKTILQLAISGQLVQQDPSEGTGQELYDQIQAEKQKLIADGKLKKQKPLPEVAENEIPFGIPESWKWVRLADATVFSIGRTPARKESTYWDDAYVPWVSIADLKSGKTINKTKESISKKAFEKCFSGRTVPAGSLLYSFKLTIGKMSIADMDVVHNEAIASFSTHSGEMTNYLFKALEVIDPTKRSKGAIMGKTLNSASLSLLEIPLPPLPEQARIIQKVTQLLDLVTELERYLENK